MENEVKNEGQFTVRRSGGGDYEITCNNFYVKDGFLVIEHKDEDIEYFPIGSVACIVKYKTKEPVSDTGSN